MGGTGFWNTWLKGFTAEANGTISDEEDVLSDRLQGTVLASVIFIIMIMMLDIDKDVKEGIVGCFADDTKVRW